MGAGAPAKPGTLALHPLRVDCGEGALEPVEVQLEGRKRMTAEAFANGQRIADNEVLGES